MAWRSLYYWFKPWSKVYKKSAVVWYSNFLYDEWFNSLTEEQQQRILERRKQREKREEESTRAYISALINMAAFIDAKVNTAPWRIR